MNGKHILILTPGFPENESDYLCIPPLQTYLKALKKQFPELRISVIAFNYPAGENKYQWHGIEVYSPLGFNERFPSSLLVRWYVWKKAKALNQQQTINTIHSFWLGDCAFIGDLLSRLWKLKHITTMMGQDAKPSNGWLKYPFHHTHQKVCLSTFQKSLIKKKSKSIFIIPWGVDLNEFPNLNDGERTIDILGVGSLISLKRFDEWVRVVAELANKNPKLKACLIGDGPELDKLKHLVEIHQITNQVQFRGVLPRPEVLTIMNQSKVLLHTSAYESQGYVLNEALAMGMQVVSSPVGFAQDSDFCITAKTTEGLTTCVLAALNNSSNNASKTALTIQDNVNAYVELY